MANVTRTSSTVIVYLRGRQLTAPAHAICKGNRVPEVAGARVCSGWPQ
jgi:hypothetical protein